MNSAHLHIILNHLPFTLVIIGLIVLICGYLFRSEITKGIAYLTFVFATVFGFVSLYTGEGAKDIIKGVKGIDQRVVTNHEDTALAFLTFLYILGILSIISLWLYWKKQSVHKIITVVIVLITFASIYYGIKAGISGGLINHAEIVN